MGISSYRCQPIVDGVGKPELKTIRRPYYMRFQRVKSADNLGSFSRSFAVHVIRAEFTLNIL